MSTARASGRRFARARRAQVRGGDAGSNRREAPDEIFLSLTPLKGAATHSESCDPTSRVARSLGAYWNLLRTLACVDNDIILVIG